MSARDSDIVELDGPPAFDYGEKVVSRKNIRNDGTVLGFDVGDILVNKGDIGYVKSIGSFLQQYYIYGIDFVDRGRVIGMKQRELLSLDYPADADDALDADPDFEPTGATT
jgi:nitrogen fixation protein NifZ